MINKFYKLFFACLVVFIAACSDRDCLKAEDCLQSEGIYGKWNWTQSIEGFGGQTITPQTTGASKHLIIDDFTYSEYEDHELVVQSQYDLAIRTDTFFDTNTFLILASGGEYAIKIREHDLEIYEMHYHGDFHYYERE